MLKRLSFLTLALGIIGAIFISVVFAWLVVIAPGTKIRQGNIEKILAVESPVYYQDGTNKIGVFFQDAHRQYIPYDQIPKDFVNGIVAAEDRNFFSHHGVDVFGILRAVVANIRAGRVVQGGSTITQQTAKNLFKRQERSIRAKLKELLYAFRLEYHYPKGKILEFYANQFYVSGNGRGFGVAARYYFDKPAQELNLLECAFIAGSVKRPNYYNPFIKRTEEAAAEARRRAKRRVKYVLGQMLNNGMIDNIAYAENVDQAVPFKQGQMYYSLNTIMDQVKDAMAEPEVEMAFDEHGIDNVATSGIKIFTTIEKDLQEKSHYALRKELSRLDVRLRGYDRDELQRVYGGLPFAGERALDGFLVGRISEIETGKKPVVHVSFAAVDSEGDKGIIDYRGIKNLLTPLVKYERQLWSTARKKDLPLILDKLAVGDLVYVSVRKIDKKSGEFILDLEKYPVVQGATLALKEGTIRAMVGGMENKYYNRAISALRSMGSVIKPLVFCASLQLGWNSMDVLNNVRNVFVYQNLPYFPRPDHESPYAGVSMSWAGVHSENVATVWLLYHLCDHLSPAQFKELLMNLGMDQMPVESDRDYRRRVRDEMGVVVNRDTLHNVAFVKAVADMEPDLIFAGKLKEYEILRGLKYGTGFNDFLAKVEAEFSEDGVDGKGLSDKIKNMSAGMRAKRRAELKIRRGVLQRNFLRYKKLWLEVKKLRRELTPEDEIESAFDNVILLSPSAPQMLSEVEEAVPEILVPALVADEEEAQGQLYYDVKSGHYVYTDEEPEDTWEIVSRSQLELALLSSKEGHEEEFWQSITIDGLLSLETIAALDQNIEQEYTNLINIPAYSPEILYKVTDFRVLAALRYLTGFCREIGIASKLDPVLSFPLGSNVISILEVARAYEGMITGNVRSINGAGNGDGLALIDRIEDSEGEVIFRPDRRVKQAVSPEISLAIGDILHNVVKFGTGRYANRNVRLHSPDLKKAKQLAELDLKVPVVGKTGTANRFTNASFAGVIPVMDDGGHFTLDNGYVLTSYVGFDDNTPMVRNTTHITGSAGALPMWTRIANTILLENDYAARLDLEDLAFSGVSSIPLHFSDYGQIVVGVDITGGGIVTGASSGKAAITTFGDKIAGGRLKPTRFFRPYWTVEEN